TLGLLLSWPSIMKLFERRREPLTEKLTPFACATFPLDNWLTPATDNARFVILRFGAIGNSPTRLASKLTPTSELVVFNRPASASTVTASSSPAKSSTMLNSAAWLRRRLIGPRIYLAKPFFSTVTSYGPGGRSGIRNNPSAVLDASR